MIISKTPLRMSFVGGGSDLKAFYEHYPGAVVSTSIDKYVYVMVSRRFDGCIRVSYSKSETVQTVDEVEHEIIREALRMTGIKDGIEVCYMGDFPIGRAGTGLGSSSALAVGALHALYTLQGETPPKERLAREACRIEIDVLGRPIGKQDQHASAHGGLNHIQFNSDESVIITPIIMEEKDKQKLRNNLCLFHTGLTAESSAVLGEQKEKTESNLEVLKEMVAFTKDLKRALDRGHIQKMGELLHENWLRKQKLASRITNDTINSAYEKARQAGAVGGKILGSGGGGFLLMYVEDETKEVVRKALQNLEEVDFNFESGGTQIVYNDGEGIRKKTNEQLK